MIHKTNVITGRGRGRRIGFPTINMEIPEDIGVTHGIYAAWIYIGETRHPAAVHFGPIPTFEEVAPTLEAYVLDQAITTLPSRVGLELVAYVRDIDRFTSQQELVAQIEEDIMDVRKLLSKHR